jgi:hypothetical protein
LVKSSSKHLTTNAYWPESGNLHTMIENEG